MIAFGMYVSDIEVETKRIDTAWNNACNYFEVDPAEHPIDASHRKCVRVNHHINVCHVLTFLMQIRSRLVSYRGRGKNRLKDQMPTLYGFKNLKPAEIKATVAYYRPSLFHVKVC
jgi:hypothetical protein